MKKTALAFAILVMSLFVASSAQAAPVFEDNFDSYNAPWYNWPGEGPWNVTTGTVDLIGQGTVHDYLPGNGLYVDLDGSTMDAGIMTISLSLNPGNYNLEFDLAGNQRPTYTDRGPDTVVVTVAGVTTLLSDSYTLAPNDPFASHQETFTVSAPGLVSISFENLPSGSYQYGDNVGAILDNVSVTSVVPVPGAFALSAIGIGLVARYRKNN